MGSRYIYIRSICSSVRFILSVCPSVCGWYAEENNSFDSSVSKTARQNRLINRGSRSDTIDCGIPCKRKTLSKNICANPILSTVEDTGAKWAILLNLSTKTTHLVNLFIVSGNPDTISIEMLSHRLAGTGSGCNSPATLLFCDLYSWHSLHDSTYAFTSAAILGQ